MEKKEEIKKVVFDYVYKNSFINKNNINEETLIFKEGYLESMGLVLLIAFLEEEYKIKIKDSDMIETNFESINMISELVLKKIG